MGKKIRGILALIMLISSITACIALKSPASADSGYSPSQVSEYNYSEEELWIERGGKKIYGRLLLPDTDTSAPLVILSHGFGGDCTNVASYAETFARGGIAAYMFDFTGGGPRSRSDGKMTEMSVLTEAQDLSCVLAYFKGREDIRTDQIFLMGESHGGFVSTYVAGAYPQDVAGLITLYPAYVLQDNCRKMTPDPDNIPETLNLMGITIGGIYNRDAMSFDIYDLMEEYPGKVLIIHGTEDSIAPITYSERAAQVFPNAELITVAGANHGFYGKTQSDAAEAALTFLLSIIAEDENDADMTLKADAVSSATLNISKLPKLKSNENSHILVAYFSPNDTIRAIAYTAADVLEADLFEIVPVDPYTEEDMNYHQPGNRAGQEQWSGARPEIVALPENLAQYDTILLGYPIWGGQAPNILYTFLENTDIRNVTILPFCTSNFVSPGTSATNLAALTDETVVWLPAERIVNGSTGSDLYEWARSLNIQQHEANRMQLWIGDTEVPILWENNPSVAVLKDLLPLDVKMSMHGGFEQVGSIGQSIACDDEQLTTEPGDVVLYSGNQIVVFYGSNHWAYTKLGHIDLPKEELTSLLGNGDVTLTIR